MIAESQVPGAPAVYVLGCLEKRVTLYSQQVRALNLVSALIDKGIITSRSKVAIVGGGGAGLTAAAALAVGVPDLKALDLYERKPDLLHLQLKSSHRYLHPHLYDWPADGSLQMNAGLPLLNWSAGTAEEVAAQILREFEDITDRCPFLKVKRKHAVERIQAFPHADCRVHVAGNPLAGDIYDVVLLSIGFGNERLTENNEANHSYWDSTFFYGPLRGGATQYKILVSGNGDGGLVDFITATFEGKSQREICEYITRRPDLEDAKRMLLEIEEEAWKPGSDIDIYEEYMVRLPQKLPSSIWGGVASMLRQDAHVLLHTRTHHLFRRDTSILNRFVTFLAIAADRNRERYEIEVVTGIEMAGSPLGKQVIFTDGRKIEPTHRCLRFGAESSVNFKPFEEHISAIQAMPGVSLDNYRPATPQLTQSVLSRYGSGLTVQEAPAVSNSNGPDREESSDLAVVLASAPNDQARWIAPITTSEARRLWADDAPELVLACHMTPSEAGPLRFVVARIAAHAPSCRLSCRDSHAWNDFLMNFVLGRRPGPNVQVKFRIKDIGDVPDTIGIGECVGIHEMASRVHLSLDFDVLERLHILIGKSLRSNGPMQMGWVIEPALRATMLARWQEWYRKLLASEIKRRRFLVLLASPDDETDIGPAGLVRVGPRCVEPHLLRPTLLGLAFAVSTEAGITPSASFPGNLAGEGMAAHALGVAWLDGRDVGPEVGLRQWLTSLVLLPELREAPLVSSKLPRLDQPKDGRPRIAHLPPHEQPLIIGCGHQTQVALSSGEAAVRHHFGKLLRERARAAVAMLDHT